MIRIRSARCTQFMIRLDAILVCCDSSVRPSRVLPLTSNVPSPRTPALCSFAI